MPEAYVTTPRGKQALIRAIKRYAPARYNDLRLIADVMGPFQAMGYTDDDTDVQERIYAYVAAARAEYIRWLNEQEGQS